MLVLVLMMSCKSVYEETTIYTGSSQLYLMTTPTSNGEEKDLSLVFYAVDETKQNGIRIDTINVSYDADSKKWTPNLGVLNDKYTLVHSSFDRTDSIKVTCEGKTVSVRGYAYGEKRLLEIAFNQKTENVSFNVEEHDLEMEDKIVIID